MTEKKKILFVILTLFVFGVIIGVTDFIRVHRFEKPLFCIGTNIADDGGSGNYVGLGYSFDIEGNFMPEDEFPGVTKWTYYLFGIELQTQIRD